MVVAEDSLLVREGIVGVLSRQDGLDVVAVCADLPELLAAVEEFTPDVAVTDVRMPPEHSDEGIRAARRLRIEHPSIGVVVLPQYIAPAYATALLGEGSACRAYLFTTCPGALDLASISGHDIAPPYVARVLVARGGRRSGADLAPRPRRPVDAAEEPAPYVMVGFSFGGIITQLYAAEHPDEIAGLVLVESNHPDEQQVFEAHLTPDQIAADHAEADANPEGIDIFGSFDQVRAAGTLPQVPLVVVTATESEGWPPGWDAALFDQTARPVTGGSGDAGPRGSAGLRRPERASSAAGATHSHHRRHQ